MMAKLSADVCEVNKKLKRVKAHKAVLTGLKEVVYKMVVMFSTSLGTSQAILWLLLRKKPHKSSVFCFRSSE